MCRIVLVNQFSASQSKSNHSSTFIVNDHINRFGSILPRKYEQGWHWTSFLRVCWSVRVHTALLSYGKFLHWEHSTNPDAVPPVATLSSHMLVVQQNSVLLIHQRGEVGTWEDGFKKC